MRLAIVLLAMPLLAADLTLSSPDGRVQFQLSFQGKSRMEYTVSFDGKPAVDASPIGIIVDGVNLVDGVQAGKSETYEVNESYPWNGPHATAVNHANGLKIALTHGKLHGTYTLEIRASNDGVAFRHVVPGSGKPRRVGAVR